MVIDWAAIAPEIVLTAGAIFILLFDLRLQGWWRQISGVLALATTLIALGFVIGLVGTTPRVTFADMFVVDGFALVLKGFFLVVGALTVVISMPYMRGHRYEGEYYFLLLTAVLGTMLMPSSRDLLMLFLALELVSIPGFVIAGLRKHDPRSNEAATKFFIFGVISAALFAYGISLVYGFTGSTNLAVINAQLSGVDPEPLVLIAVVLLVGAFGFKISAVPFHFWAPDTYEGSPTPLAAYLSVASKATGFVGLALMMLLGFPALVAHWAPVVAIICLATMTVGNVVALRQRHLIRLLAYSSIGHAGYMLIPIAVIQAGEPGAGGIVGAANMQDVVNALVVYFLIYAAMNLGAFAVAVGISKQYPTLLIRDLAGLARRAPLHAAALTAFLISLAGIPPLAGWAAKFFVFLAAVNAGTTLGIVLAVGMVVNSVVSLYYYLGVARVMYLQDPTEPHALRFPTMVTATVGLCLAFVLVGGVFPELFVQFAGAARLLMP